MDSDAHPRAEEALRLIASAVNAVRLYPPSSALPTEAASKFTVRANEVMESVGPLRFVVDPHEFRIGDDVVASGFGQAAQLAESLHALQVGQLILAPGLTARETSAFIGVVLADPIRVRSDGGVRAALVRAGVEHIAAIEVSLRASSEDGLLGVDLATAPLDEIAREVVAAAESWASSAANGVGQDDVKAVIGQLEQATRNIAMERVAEALMRVDETTRMKVLAWSLRADANGHRMDGMLQVLARMKPAALARLLAIVADQAGTDPQRIAGAMELPPEVAKELSRLFGTPERSDAECGVPPQIAHADIAREVSSGSDGDVERQIAVASPALASGKALATAVAVSRMHPDVETVRVIAAAMPKAAQEGAFPPVREALRRLDELAHDPALTEEVAAARATLSDAHILSDVCVATQTDADAAIAGEILAAAGVHGAEVLVRFYSSSGERQRSLMRPVLRGMGEAVVGLASRSLRGEDPKASVAVISVLPLLGDKRTVPTLVQALQDVHTEVRLAAVRALADTPDREARQALSKALNHWDPETQRLALRQIARVRAAEAVPAMVRSLEDINILKRNYELRKELIRSLEQVGSPDALPALRRVSQRIAVRPKTKELKLLARHAVVSISRQQKEAALLATPVPEPISAVSEGVDPRA